MATFSGIYKIQSKIKPERCYIGSAVNLNKRKHSHFNDLKRNIHGNSKLQRHYVKYGKEDLVFVIMGIYAKDDILIKEQFYIDSINPWFNICKIAGNCIGIKRSEEYKKKLSGILKGKKTPWMEGRIVSQETKDKISAALMGRKATKETRLKLSEIKKGKKQSKGWVIKRVISRKNNNILRRELGLRVGFEGKTPWNKGKTKNTDAILLKMSDKKKGIPHGHKTNNGMIFPNAKKRPPQTEEQKRKIKDAIIKWWRKRKEIGLIGNNIINHAV